MGTEGLQPVIEKKRVHDGITYKLHVHLTNPPEHSPYYLAVQREMYGIIYIEEQYYKRYATNTYVQDHETVRPDDEKGNQAEEWTFVKITPFRGQSVDEVVKQLVVQRLKAEYGKKPDPEQIDSVISCIRGETEYAEDGVSPEPTV